MEKNKTGKYLKYAIGEIVLVVIGILIALSINNWNNNNIRAKEEGSLLKDMIMDLNQNITASNNALKIHTNLLIKNISLRKALLKKTSDQDSLSNLIRYLNGSATPTYSASTYKTLSQTGLNIIQSDTLRKSILRYYEVHLPYVNEKSNLDPKNQFQALLKPYFNKYFKIELHSNDSIKRTTSNSVEMFNDNKFLNELHTTVRSRRKLIQHLENSKEKAKGRIKAINNYLAKENK
tara:strand:+ start:32081 stop:32785 length:705 start_codon:yes stop_codon:yes gene_type:complete